MNRQTKGVLLMQDESGYPQSHVFLSKSDVKIAKKVLNGLQSKMISGGNGSVSVALTPDFAEKLVLILEFLAFGGSVSNFRTGSKISMERAGQILNMVPSHVLELLKEEDIPFEKQGDHVFVSLEDICSYKKRRDKLRSEAMTAMLESDAEILETD